MKHLVVLSCIALSMTVCVAQQSWSGNYVGQIEGTRSTMELKQDQTTVSGQVNAGGYLYTISCVINDGSCKGTLEDPQAQSSLPASLSRDENKITLTVSVTDAYSGQVQRSQYKFLKGENNEATVPSTPAQSVSRDMQIVGNWSYTDTYMSGDFSAVTQYKLGIYQDGTYLYGESSRGQWKTENSIIYINEGQGWVPYCKYYLEGNSLMMTFEDGKRQVWNR